MVLTQIAQVCSIIGVTIALVKIGIDIKKESKSTKEHMGNHMSNVYTALTGLREDLREHVKKTEKELDELNGRVINLEERRNASKYDEPKSFRFYE